MIRMYCDICGKEVDTTRRLYGKLLGENGNWVEVKVLTAVNGTWNGGHPCEDCIRKAIERAERSMIE